MPHRRIIELDPDEVVELEVRRHAFGLVPIVLVTLFILGGVLAALIVATKFESAIARTVDPTIVYIVLSVLALLVLGGGAISFFIYRANVLILTNENLVQVNQVSLLSRSVSQLSLSKIQDVTVAQRGFFPSIFGYGSINIETAGEAANFSFIYGRNPYENAKLILEAHERYVEKHGDSGDGV